MGTSDKIAAALALATAAFVSTPGALQAQGTVVPGRRVPRRDIVPGPRTPGNFELSGGVRHRGGISWDRDFLITRSGNRDFPALRLRDDAGRGEFELDVDGEEVFIEAGLRLPRFILRGGFERYQYDGSFATGPVLFEQGLGVPFVGGKPGVFFNGPHQVNWARFDTKRDGWDGSIALGYDLGPFGKGVDLGGGGSQLNLEPYIGFQFGQFDQSERFSAETSFTNFPNLIFDIWYNTDFDTDYLGGSLGLKAESRTPLTSVVDLILGADVAYLGRQYDLDVRDSVRVNNLLQLQDSTRFSHEDTLHGYKVNGSIGLGTGLWDISVGGGVTNMVPKFSYSRPDSTPAGEPLPPRVSIDTDTTWSAELRARFRFGTPMQTF